MKISNGYFTVNVSDNKENYSQRNNKYVHKSVDIVDVNASTMCNVTSICMAADYNGWQFPNGEFEQPEDNLAKFIMESKDVDSYYKNNSEFYKDYIAKKMKDGKPDYYTPNEIHSVLAYGTNLWFGHTVDTFKLNASIWDIINELIEGRACVLSGKFGKLNHIVTLVGVEWKVSWSDTSATGMTKCLNQIKEKNILPANFIIDDPYGDYRTGYTSKSGNDVKLSYDDFIHIFKPVDNAAIKWCHFISSGAAEV